ncbi:hypothetical protein HY212_07560 [Candidatus Pacearchaeota archaeon]|nr:hypothetical protein [Candidatus Pacearchaeota archaeon]
MKKDYRKEILVLSFLVAITVMLNFSLILIIETHKGGTVRERIIRTFTGDNQLDIFSSSIIGKNINTGTKISKTGTTTKTRSTTQKPTLPKLTTSNQKTLLYKGEIPLTVDYDKGTIRFQGKEIPIIVEGGTWSDVQNLIKSVSFWHPLTYQNFDVFVDEGYYNANAPQLNVFFDNFDKRYSILKNQTGWSSEKFYNKKLSINVTGISNNCFGVNYGATGQVFLQFSDPFYMQNCSASGGTGELGDMWPYMGVALHESLHAINPFPIYARSWLTEGLSRYYQFNILSGYGDISQQTANQTIYQGTSQYNWPGYVSNNYKDTSPSNSEIQLSAGYDITAWMFSMMRDNHNLNWSKFYQLVGNNEETLNQSYNILGEPSWYSIYTDTHIIDLFGRSSGLTFPQTKRVWEYNLTSPAGWGVRNWTDTNGVVNWYADLKPNLSFSMSSPSVNDNAQLIANVSNNGDFSLNNVSVRFYSGANLLNEQVVSVPALGNIVVSTTLNSTGNYSNNVITVKVDEDNIKVESNETNNVDSRNLVFGCGDLDGSITKSPSGAIDVIDVVKMIGVAFRGAKQEEPSWVWDVDSSGAVDVLDVVREINVAFRGANANTELKCGQSSPPGPLALSSQDAKELTQILNNYGVKNVDLNKYVSSK